MVDPSRIRLVNRLYAIFAIEEALPPEAQLSDAVAAEFTDIRLRLAALDGVKPIVRVKARTVRLPPV